MAFVLMGLGSLDPEAGDESTILFYIPLPKNDTPGFETLQRDSQYTWPSNDRLSRRPAMQFTGPGEENFIVEGRMFPYHFGGLSTIARMRAGGESGKPFILVRFYDLTSDSGAITDIQTLQGRTTTGTKLSYGCEPIGNFVITRVRTTESKIGTIGLSHKIDFSLELKRYGDDLIIPTADTSLGKGQI